MYKEEKRTSNLPEETCADRFGSSMINRAPTNGKYGIWGHSLGDLVLHTVHYDPTGKVIKLGIDS